MFTRLGIALCLAAWALASHAALGRWALVVGINQYESLPKLANAVPDARTIEAELKRAGFDVRTVVDADRRTLLREVIALSRRAEGGGEAVFFYSGHGVQIDSSNYLLPADFRAQDASMVPYEAVSLNEISNHLREAKTRFSLLIIDACRNNPLPRPAGRTIGAARGLAPMSAVSGQMIVFSAGTGQEALDSLGPDDPESNSVFVREFVKKMRVPGLDVRDAVDRTKESVEALAASVRHEQRPAVYDESKGRFYFHPPSAATAAPAPGAVAGAAPAAGAGAGAGGGNGVRGAGARSGEQIEDELWARIRGSGNPLAFEAYLREYPNGRYARAARIELTLARPGTAAAAASAPASVPSAAPRAAPTGPVAMARPPASGASQAVTGTAPFDLTRLEAGAALPSLSPAIANRSITLPAGAWRLEGLEPMRVESGLSYFHNVVDGRSAVLAARIGGMPAVVALEASLSESWRQRPGQGTDTGRWHDALCDRVPNEGAVYYAFNDDYDNPGCVSVHAATERPRPVRPGIFERMTQALVATGAAPSDPVYLVSYGRFYYSEYFMVFVLAPQRAFGGADAAAAWARRLGEALEPVAEYRATAGVVPALPVAR